VVILASAKELVNIADKIIMPDKIRVSIRAMNQFAIIFENRLPNSGFQSSSLTQIF
jgi:hypothetical protein